MEEPPIGFDTEVNRFLALELASRTATTAAVSMPLRDAYSQGTGLVQGGIISSLADAAAVAVLAPGLSFGRGMTCIEFKMNFLRPASGRGGSLLAEARVIRSGKTIAVCDVEVLQGSEMVAKGLFTYLYLAPR